MITMTVISSAPSITCGLEMSVSQLNLWFSSTIWRPSGLGFIFPKENHRVKLIIARTQNTKLIEFFLVKDANLYFRARRASL
jgi:hypothetical protein